MAAANDFDSSNYSLSITHIICYSEKSEWILDIGTIYHICPKQEWFASFEKLVGVGDIWRWSYMLDWRDRYSSRQVVWWDDNRFEIVRYVPQLKKNMSSVGTLEAHGLIGTLREGVLKISSSLLVVLKGTRRNNLYYLKGSAIIEILATSEHLEDDAIRLWQMSLGQVGLNSLKALANQGLLEDALTCNLKFGERCVLDKKTKWNLAPQFTTRKVFLIVFTLMFRVVPRSHRLLIIYLGSVGYTLWDKDLKF